ncbi:class I tRNA ligase family protein, partial [Patescibacteria group bacterium]|nr:class I tRNA ligase family protein [Patescibacteria group bacterium]
KIPIIADEAVDAKFGTGAVKVTPAHDSTDFEIGQRNKLKIISVIGQNGKMTSSAGNFSGLTISGARQKIIAELKRQNLIEKVVDYSHSVGVCERCRTNIEPLVSKQWFLKIAPLAKPAIEAVKSGKIQILPKPFEKIYFNWMENIRDWCISRQIWWGHQMPIYYCKGMENKNCKSKDGVFVSIEAPRKCPNCNSRQFEQETDTLDTWFSSGQWPYTTLGWPKESEDYKYFYTTSVMETGYDILFFWVARMIMLGLYSTGKPPFHTVFLHGLVRDEHGQKMSKSKGNVVDPLEVAEKYGADAVRMALVFGTSPGNDLNLGESKIRGMRNFTNKLWNIGRFIIEMRPEKSKKTEPNEHDKWIRDELKAVKSIVTIRISEYRFGIAAEVLHNFIWHQLADSYIEHTKTRREEAQPVLEEVFEETLRLLHPFMPFITEELWQRLPNKKGDSIMISAWPN